MSGHNDVTSATRCTVLAVGLAGALLVVVPTGPGSGPSGPGGQPPPSTPAEGTSLPPDDEPVLQPADDSQVVLLDEAEQVEPTEEDPGAVESEDDADDGAGALDAARLDLVRAIGAGLLVLISLMLTAISTIRLRRMLHAWWSPASLGETDLEHERLTTSFSLVVVGGRNDEGFGRTLERLAAFDHPDVEILAVVGQEELGAREVATAAAYRHPDRIRLVVDRDVRGHETRALNTGLAACRGDVLGVFQAGDEVRPGLLRHVEAALATTGADVVQSGVLLTAENPSWFSVRRMLESYFWFRSRLRYYAQQRFVPLATTSLFGRVNVLRGADGWAGDAVAEGCELGVRLSVAGVPVAVTWDPQLVTGTAMPPSIRALSDEQTRWIQGFLQVLRRGAWRSLPTRRQCALARVTLAMPFLEAVAGAAVPALAAVAVVADAPPPIVLAAFLPLIPALTTLVVEMVGLGELGRTSGVRTRTRDWVRLLLGAVPYQLLLGAAALRALVRELRGDRSPDTASHMNDDAAGTDAVDRPRLVARSTGRREQFDHLVTKTGAVDR